MKRDSSLGWEKFLKANGYDLGMLTGQDRRALSAISACWELYAVGDLDGRMVAIEAIKPLVRGSMQPKCRYLARDLIAYTMDWTDIARLWPQVSEGLS